MPLYNPSSTFTPEAAERWNKVPKWAQQKVLDNVFCTKCIGATPVASGIFVNLFLRVAAIANKSHFARARTYPTGAIKNRIFDKWWRKFRRTRCADKN